jgi:hypothetical protein
MKEKKRKKMKNGGLLSGLFSFELFKEHKEKKGEKLMTIRKLSTHEKDIIDNPK